MTSMMQRSLLSLSQSLKGLSNTGAIAVKLRLYSSKEETAKVDEKDVTKSVFISQSTNIFTNLALEDWIYKNLDFSKHQVLMVWRNEPCVVIGRHQNPWVEANLPFLMEQGIPLARRNSGGGTVYHDRGNLNLSFFSTKEKYNRKYNLELITRALFREFGLTTDINKREDIVVNQKYKVSFSILITVIVIVLILSLINNSVIIILLEKQC